MQKNTSGFSHFFPGAKLRTCWQSIIKSPHLRVLQKRLAKEITILVHSEEDYIAALEASEILFGKGTTESLAAMKESLFLSVFEGVPQVDVTSNSIGKSLLEFLVDDTRIFSSKGELRRMIQGGGLSINKQKVDSEQRIISREDFLNGNYILIQKGKKNYFLIKLN